MEDMRDITPFIGINVIDYYFGAELLAQILEVNFADLIDSFSLF